MKNIKIPPLVIPTSPFENIAKAMRQMYAQNEAELTNLCIVANMSRTEALELVSKSPLSARQLSDYYAAFGRFPGEGQEMEGHSSSNWFNLTDFTLPDDRSRLEKFRDTATDFLQGKVYSFWYWFFYLLFCLFVTPVRAAWDALKWVWIDAGSDFREDDD